MRRLLGSRVYDWRRCGRLKRGFQIVPTRGTKDYYVRHPRALILHRWIAHRGLFILALCDAEPPHATRENWGFPEDWKMGVKKRVQTGDLPTLPFLSVETTLMKKQPLLIEFVSATTYEDGSPRTPGYYTVRNRMIEYECTLYDPDSGQRIAIRAREVDKMWLGVEAILGAQDAPWEVDRYLFEQLEQKNKKKGVASRKKKA